MVSPNCGIRVGVLDFAHLRWFETDSVEEHLPLEVIGHHPAVLVLIGILGRNTADANDLGVVGKVRRTMLPTMSAVALLFGGDLALPETVALPTRKQEQENGSQVCGLTYQNDMGLGHGVLEAVVPSRGALGRSRHDRSGRCQQRKLNKMGMVNLRFSDISVGREVS